MTGSIWLISYDIAAKNEVAYLDWFHDVHIPEKLARPGYTWAAHYEVIAPDGKPVAIGEDTAAGEARGFVAIFGGVDTRTFLDPSPAQIKPNQPPLTREMMTMRLGSKSLIAAAEWRHEGAGVDAPGYPYLELTASDTPGNDEDYGAWCVQVLCPHLGALPGFEVAAKWLSTTAAAKHVVVASFATLAALQACHGERPRDAWSERVAGYQDFRDGRALLARRIWPHLDTD